MQNNAKYLTYLYSPVGLLRIEADNEAVTRIEWDTELSPVVVNHIVQQAKYELLEYFGGERQAFDVPTHPVGSPFQTRVWQALTKVPFGTTASYKKISLMIKNPKAMRAVGHANSLNPIPIIIPCHRVIGSNGDLVGYAGGLNRKKLLLQHESKFKQLSMF